MTLIFHIPLATNIFFHVCCLCFRLYAFWLYPQDMCTLTSLNCRTLLLLSVTKNVRCLFDFKFHIISLTAIFTAFPLFACALYAKALHKKLEAANAIKYYTKQLFNTLYLLMLFSFAIYIYIYIYISVKLKMKNDIFR